MRNALSAYSHFFKIDKEECTSICVFKKPRKWADSCTEISVIEGSSGMCCWRGGDKMCQHVRGGGDCCCNWRTRRVFTKEIEVEQNLGEWLGFEHMEPGWSSSRQRTTQASNRRQKFWGMYCKKESGLNCRIPEGRGVVGRNMLDHSTVRLKIWGFTLEAWGRLWGFVNIGIPVHNGTSKQFIQSLCLLWIEEGSNLGFWEWMEVIGGVLEDELGGRTATMAMGVVMG